MNALVEDASFIRAALDAVPRLLQIADGVEVPADATALYRYQVPEFNDDGTCSLELADEPYDLHRILRGEETTTTQALARLNAIVASLQADTGCGWLGIYQTRNGPDGRVLVKLCYRGRPSRAEFPLTEEFAAHSNNSTVGLSGQARVIDDVASYVSEGGAYYTCDSAVQSEACLPLFNDAGGEVGIIDAEDAEAGRFRGVSLAPFVALALVAPAHLPPGLILTPVYRITTFVPPDRLNRLLAAIESVVPLQYGRYDRVAWWSCLEGVEQFRPLKDSDPTSSVEGEVKRGKSVRLEFVIPRERDLLERVLSFAIWKNGHPWEEPVVFVDESNVRVRHPI